MEKESKKQCNFVPYGEVENRCTKCGYITWANKDKGIEEILEDMANKGYPRPSCREVVNYKEITSHCRSFLHKIEPEVIHIHKIRENEYMVVHEDAHDINTGKVEIFFDKEVLENKFNIKL